MDQPIGSANKVSTGRERAGVAGGVVGGTGTRVLGPGDLSRQPMQPPADVVNAALERSYPKNLRDQGLEGVARIRVRVLASGKLQPLATLNETRPGSPTPAARACATAFSPAWSQRPARRDRDPVHLPLHDRVAMGPRAAACAG